MTAPDDDALSINIVRGNPTEEELAAVLAVVSEAYAAEASAAVAEEPATRSAWSHATRALRRPLNRTVGW